MQAHGFFCAGARQLKDIVQKKKYVTLVEGGNQEWPDTLTTTSA
jgi:hypothetical protein